MNDLKVQRTPELIAAEINSIKKQTRKTVMYNCIEIGRRLVEAKEMIPHGEWGKWLQEKVDYSQRTANNLMRIFEEYGSDQLTLLEDNSNSQALANLSYTQAVALLAVSAEEREQFVQEHDVENLSTRELQKKLEEYKQLANEKSEEAEKLREEKQKAEAVVKTLQDETEALRKRVQEAEAKGNADEVKRLNELLQESDSQLYDAQEKIKDLEKQLKERPIETAVATIEKIPEEVEKELNELRKKAKNISNDTAVLKFKVHFDDLVKGFKELLNDLEEIREVDPSMHENYKNAVVGLINKMSERLQ